MKAWVLGNGPTLPVDALHRLSGEFTVGVNLILRSGFTPSVVYWLDNMERAGFPTFSQDAAASGAVTVNKARRENPLAEFWLRRRTPMVLERERTPVGSEDPCIIYGSTSSGAAAVRWCFALGFERVGLLGFGGVGHFDGRPTPARSVEGYEVELARLHARYGDRISHEDDPTAWVLGGGWDAARARSLVCAKCATCYKGAQNQRARGA